jgi:hypothetical protein
LARDLEAVLGPTWRPGPLVVLDHLRVHKAASMRQAIAARRGERLFRPPSSPGFTPIEPACSTVKPILRGLGARARDTLVEASRLAGAAIPRDDAAAWFTHAGYALPGQGQSKLL